MGKLIRKRTFIGNISLVIFLAFLFTVTFGTSTYATVTPTSNPNLNVVVDQNTPVKVLGDNGWQAPGGSADLTTNVGSTSVKFTIQVLTQGFDSLYLQIQSLLPGQNNRVADIDSSVMSATYKAVYGAVYYVYQLVYTYTNPSGFDPDDTNWLKVYSSDFNVQTIGLDLEEPVPIPNDGSTQTVTNQPVALTSANTATVNLTIPTGVAEPKLNIGAILPAPAPGATTVTSSALPEINMSRTDGTVVQIPAGTKVTGPADWTGVIQMPTVVTNPTPVAGQTIGTAIEVGFGDVELTFDTPVKIVIPNQAGKNARWTRGTDGGNIQAIALCTTPAQATAALTAPNPDLEEGKHDSGSDLVIWTMHFTQFITYTQTSSSSKGGGGGSDSLYVTSTTGSAKVYPSDGGSIGLGSDATVKIPAKALKGSSQVEVKVEKVTSPAAAPAGYKLISGVYDFIVGGSHEYTFDKKVTVTLKFDPALAAGKTPVIYDYHEGTSEWTKLGGTVSGSNISVETDHIGQFAVLVEDKAVVVPPAPGGLTDIKGHWAEQAIADMVSKGILGGYPDKTFKPDRTMSRTEFAVVVAKAFNLTPDATYALKFKDADKIPAWGKAYVAAAVKAGIVSGDDRGNFNPAGNITRAEMACMVGRALNAEAAANPKLEFKDKVPAWAAGYVDYLVKNDVLTGYADNTFKAGNTATRAEACTVIYGALKI